MQFTKVSKDHKCESCGKSFSTAQSLKKHKHTVHAGHRRRISNETHIYYSRKQQRSVLSCGLINQCLVKNLHTLCCF